MYNHFRGAANPLAILGMNPGPQHVGSVGNYPGVSGMDFVGAARTPRHWQQQQIANAQYAQGLPAQYAPTPAAVTGTDPGKMAALQQLAMAQYVPQILLGIGDDTNKVAAGTTTNFSPEGSVPLRITALTIAGSIAPFFVITQFTVARLNLLAGSGSVPAENFIQDSRRPPLEMPILAAGSQVVVGAKNIDANAHLFIGSVSAIDLTSTSARMIP